MLLSLLVLAQDATGNTAEPPGPGTALPIIFGVLAALVLGAVLLHLFLAKATRASKGGVQPPREEQGTTQSPPLEGIEQRS